MFSSASRGRPSSRTSRPAAAWSGSTTNSTTSAPRRRIAVDSISGAGSAASVVVTPSHLANGSNVVPWTIVETSTAKKMMLKNSWLCGTPSITGKIASTTGTAPRSPAHPSTARSGSVNPANAVATITATGRATTATISASVLPLTATDPS